jgi:divalent metal cation (Fe/Co/Zn/Cd) transporter
VEMSSGLVILWQFRHPMPETRERRALRLIAFSFFALAGYVAFESVRSLIGGDQAESSTVGIVIAALSLVIMPLLSWGQRRTGQALGSTTVVADSKQTLLCTYLSGVLLVGLVLNSTMGWWWADPLVGLLVAGLAVREGREAWRGESCTCIPAVPEATDNSCDSAEGGCTS